MQSPGESFSNALLEAQAVILDEVGVEPEREHAVLHAAAEGELDKLDAHVLVDDHRRAAVQHATLIVARLLVSQALRRVLLVEHLYGTHTHRERE